MSQIKINQIYQHYKNNHYQIIALAKHHETLEEMVVYKALYGENEIWIRPSSEFLEIISFEGKLIPRFLLISERT